MSSMDLRQAFAGLLTLSMFIMLGNMIKKDHFDYSINDVDIQVSEHESVAVTEPSFATVSHLSKKSLKKNDQGLKPCWNPPPLKEVEQSKGFILFSLTNGPEYHISQIADAVVVARYLGATLVLPDIKSSKSGHIMSLGDIYDVENVLNKLNELVKVTRTLPPQVSNRNTPKIRVPNKVSQDYIMKKVKPIYKAKGIIKIESYFPSVNNTTMGRNKNNLDSLTCKAMFGTLELKSEIEEVAESVIQKLQTWSQESSGKFIAVDLRIDVLKKECNGKDEKGRKLCYQGHEIGEFLKKIGFGQETVVYVTQTKWSPDLNALRYMFPKTYTKENIMSATNKEKFLSSESIEFEKVIDFYICSQSDIFVPSISGPFYDNVAGMRIVSGKNQILVPSEIVSPSASASEHFSPYVTQKSHFAYACFC